tara:strand:- start:2541 stop:2807 length:267 start_codon:yes stop_codon:yes gene_type:complete
MDKEAKRKTLDINVALALVKCLTEQLHGMKWDHSNSVKMKFNRLLKCANQYEKEINKAMKDSEDNSIEDIYDAFMDSICEAKEIALKE